MRTARDRGPTTVGTVTISLGKVRHVSKLEHNLVSERQASLMSKLVFVKSPTVTHLGTRINMCCDLSYSTSSGLYEIAAKERKAKPKRALAARAQPQRDIMEVHRLFTHPSEHTLGQQQKQLTLS